MPVTPNDFLIIAVDPSSASSEMILRNAISRAYYSGYLHAKQKTHNAGIQLPSGSGGVHQQLIKAFELGLCGDVSNGLSTVQQNKIAGLLSMTKHLRTKSDYKLHLSVNETEKATAIANCQTIQSLMP
ncbi:hypothetical protein [Yersinia intermedia]|uniref:hypothetical protein n=1 Tax=Yersinia intermedia TaxID=631 RepID=UPI0011A89572|nr:hypothetical protein [Yersinia intermedia]